MTALVPLPAPLRPTTTRRAVAAAEILISANHLAQDSALAHAARRGTERTAKGIVFG